MSEDSGTGAKARFVVGALIGLIVLGGVLWAVFWFMRGTETTEKQQDVYQQAIGRLEIEGGSGDVEIVGTDADEVVVHRTVSWSGDGKPKSIETWSGDTLRIGVEGCGGVNFLGLGGACGISYRIEVPAATELVVSNDSGEVTVDGITGAQKINVDSGDVVVTGAADDLAIQADSGDVTVTDMNGGSFTGDVDSGDIRLDFAAAPDEITVDADSGGVDITLPNDGQPYRVEATVDSGDSAVNVDQSPDATRTITVDVDSGDLKIEYA